MSTNFFASSKRPELIPYDGDLLDGIDVRLEKLNAERAGITRLRMERERARGSNPRSIRSRRHLTMKTGRRTLAGLSVSLSAEKFPVHWDTSGAIS